MESGLAVAVIVGLAVGSAFVLLFALEAPPSTHPIHQAQGNGLSKVEFPIKYNRTQIPDMHLVVKSDAKRYAGEEGSYCWDTECGDTDRIVSENTIVLHKGSEIEFEIQNYRTPEIFNVYVNREPEPVPICRYDYDNATNTITQTCDFPPELPPLTKLADEFTYLVDLPEGVYLIDAAANWITKDGYGESDASYFYLIRVI